jgi:hypothetical protein
MMRRFMAKAAQDGVRAIVVVALSITAFYWRGLLEVAVPVNDRGDLFEPLRNLREMLTLPDQYRGTALALFAVDFSRLASRSAAADIAPGCGQEHLFRGRPSEGHTPDAEDRSRIRHRLSQSCGLATGDCTPPSK